MWVGRDFTSEEEPQREHSEETGLRGSPPTGLNAFDEAHRPASRGVWTCTGGVGSPQGLVSNRSPTWLCGQAVVTEQLAQPEAQVPGTSSGTSSWAAEIG